MKVNYAPKLRPEYLFFFPFCEVNNETKVSACPEITWTIWALYNKDITWQEIFYNNRRQNER